MEFLTSFFARNGLLPHGYCYTWAPGLLWSMVAADALIAAAYFSIPAGLVSFARRRSNSHLRGLMCLFSGFIFACGLTHLMDIWTIWQPDYALQVLTKLLTAAISLVTAVALWRLIPQASKSPRVGALPRVIQSLEAEVARRRSAEEHLTDVEQNLAVTLSSIGAGFLATDREGCVTRMNSVAEQVLGWTQAQARGHSIWQVFNREDRPPGYLERNPVDVLIAEDFKVDVGRHLIAVSSNGQRTPVEVKAALTHAEDGSVRGMAVVFRDLTRRVRGEAERGRLAAIVDSSSDAIIGKTLDGRITSWNGAAQVLFGYSAAEAIGQRVQILIPPEREDEEMRVLAQLSRGELVPTFETVRRARDGRLIAVSLSISPIRDSRGNIIGASKIARDITQQRAAEAALRDSEARLRFTLESAQLGDWGLDLATGRMTRSLRHDRCFGYATPQADWSFDTFIQHLHPDDRAEVRRGFQDSLATGADWSADARVRWPDGSTHWIRAQAGIRQEEPGQARRMLGIVSDITQHKLDEQSRLLAQRLEAQNRQIQEASRLKSQFLANMSHELRTPLNAIIGFADLMHKGMVKPESPKHHEYLGHIGNSGRHLLQLINDVLDLSKVESGKFEFFPEPVQLPQLVQEVVGVLQGAMQRKHLELHTELDPSLGELVLDPARLKQALYNYLSNAIKFTPDGRQVTVRARPEGATRWRLEVQDTGIGIAQADLPRLFSEFQQLDAGYGKQHQGTGLGLALTRRLVEAQGGSVGVHSILGRGSVFHLVLDRVQGSAQGAGPQRMLVIDADAAQQSRLARALVDAGFVVDGAATGEHALQQARAQVYGAITLSLVMPDQGGLDLLVRIRHGGASRGAPVLGVSMPGEPGSAAIFPVTDVLFKPIRTDEVVAALSRLGMPRQARVMVVDDDPLALRLMQATLAGMGITAVCVEGGQQALRELAALPPDALILDLMMPGFDGFETLDALRRLPAGAELPVFIWTSMMLTEDEVASLSRSAGAILGKGGGSLAPLLDSLRRWRLPAALSTQGG